MATERTEVTRAGQAGPMHALSPFEDMERMMEGFFPRGWMRPLRWGWPAWSEAAPMPRIDVLDRDEDILLRAELPGVEKKDLDISVSGNTVTLKGQTVHEEKEEKGDYYRHEIAQGTFTRTMVLPAEVDADKAEASFKDGMLELKLPKMEGAKRHSIKIE
ncbi:MAG: Hsp20/alpha crystallin family protein [Betaproteobacteria bacterium]|nr:Hsp20/alpha crystallin family protein [Betaproteobacteria bacterium]